jgi:hypothetical protein
VTWPTDKLATINNALTLTGDNLCNVAEDGSDEWQVGSVAYETGYEYLLEAHDWKFATKVGVLQRSGTPADDYFTDAYAKPPDCVHLIWVRLQDTPVIYIILGNQVALSAGGGAVTAKWVSSTAADQAATRLFFAVLHLMVMSGIYRGLHEDTNAADRHWAEAMAMLEQAKVRSDQEQPKRAFFNSRLAAARMIRRPWLRTPPGWGGTGSPG